MRNPFRGHCQTNLNGPAKGAGVRRSGRQLTGRTVEIAEGIAHRRRLRNLARRLKPIYSDNACGTPLPSRYICPRLLCALASPCSAARRYHFTASASSCGTPLPRRYILPRLFCASGCGDCAARWHRPARLKPIYSDNATSLSAIRKRGTRATIRCPGMVTGTG
jgi:hypothetical protein